MVTYVSDGDTRVWDTTEWKLRADLRGHTRSVSAAAFNPTATRVATAGHDGTVRVWDADDVNRLGPEYNNKYTTSGARHGILRDEGNETRLYRLDRPEVVAATFHGHARNVLSSLLSPDGNQVATVSLDGTARVWDAASGKSIAVMSGHAQPPLRAAFSPDGSKLATAGHDATARV